MAASPGDSQGVYFRPFQTLGIFNFIIIYGRHWRLYAEYTENKMSIFEKTKHCTKRFPCRYKLVMMASTLAIIASIVAVPFISEIA